jgi:hypothetical protein
MVARLAKNLSGIAHSCVRRGSPELRERPISVPTAWQAASLQAAVAALMVSSDAGKLSERDTQMQAYPNDVARLLPRHAGQKAGGRAEALPTIGLRSIA